MGAFFIDRDVFHPLIAKIQAREASVEETAILNTLYRINIVSAIYEAGHGWLGGSLSCVEVLSTIFHRYLPSPLKPLTERNSLILSKGHAIVTQYTIMASLGVLPTTDLATYKKKNGLPAHSDRDTPGVDASSGSLGQGVSKALGISRILRNAGSPYKCFVLIGDGELQEGQVFESLLTLKQWGENLCIPIIDRNFLQSDSRSGDIKDAVDWPAVFRGIGFEVFVVDGHNPREIELTLDACHIEEKPCLLIAETIKGYGSSITAMPRNTPPRQGVWHGKVPGADDYHKIITELVETVGLAPVKTAWQNFRNPVSSVSTTSTGEGGGVSTVQAFGEALVQAGQADPLLWVLSADMAKPCRLTEFAQRFPHRFLEAGISEQDVVSIAGGIGLAGGIAVVNTFASFLKRGYDQIFALVQDRLPVIIAGHYSGLDYFTDGKSHQSLNDIGFIRMFSEIDVFEPVNAQETHFVFRNLLERMNGEIRSGKTSRPAYVRLHRQTPKRVIRLPEHVAFDSPYLFPGLAGKEARKARIFAASPHFLEAALNLRERFLNENISLDVVKVSAYQDGSGALRKLWVENVPVFVLESHHRNGGLADFLQQLEPREFHWFGPAQYSPCTRTFAGQLSFHRLDEESLYLRLKEWLIMHATSRKTATDIGAMREAGRGI